MLWPNVPHTDTFGDEEIILSARVRLVEIPDWNSCNSISQTHLGEKLPSFSTLRMQYFPQFVLRLRKNKPIYSSNFFERVYTRVSVVTFNLLLQLFFLKIYTILYLDRLIKIIWIHSLQHSFRVHWYQSYLMEMKKVWETFFLLFQRQTHVKFI